MMSFVPLAPLYGYVVGIDEAKANARHRRELDEMCHLLVEAMEAGGCGWSAQIARRGRQRPARLRRHADGHRLHDRARGRRVRPRAAASVGRGVVADRPGRSTAAELIARESGRPDHLERAARRRRAQPARRRRVLAPRRDRSSSRTSTRRRVCASSRRRSRRTSSRSSPSRTTTSLDTMPCWKEALPRHDRGEAGQARRSRASAGDEGDPRRARRAVRRGYVARRDQGQLDLQRRRRTRRRSRSTTRATRIGEIADRENKHPIDAMLDIAVAGDLKVGFATQAARDAARGDEGDRQLAGGAPRRQRRRRAHEVRHDRAATRPSCSRSGCASTRSCRWRRRTGACRRTRRGRRAHATADRSARARRPTSIVYDYETPRQRPAGTTLGLPGRRDGAWSRRPSATSTSSSTASRPSSTANAPARLPASCSATAPPEEATR